VIVAAVDLGVDLASPLIGDLDGATTLCAAGEAREQIPGSGALSAQSGGRIVSYEARKVTLCSLIPGQKAQLSIRATLVEDP